MYKVFAVVGLTLAALLGLGACSRGSRRAAQEAEQQARQQEWWELGMADEILDQVLLFYLGEAWCGLTEVGEVLETANRVDAEDPESWAREWRITAERLNGEADRLLAEGHRWSAGQYYLRASSYYRAVMHRHMHPGSAEVKELTEREVACFIESQKLLEAPMEVVEVPFEGIELTGYFYRSPRAEGASPTLIVHQGRDAWAEDCLYMAEEAVRRGYNCLLIDGPGNGQALRRHDLPFRPDWETFVTPVVDFLLARPDVDPEGIMLMGASMGGYLAPRAAAYENRLRIVIANPGVIDWSEIILVKMEEYAPQLMSVHRRSPAALDAVVGAAERLSPFLRWAMADMLWKHGNEKTSEFLDELPAYSNVSGAPQIRAATLIIDGEEEDFGQARELYDALTCEKDYMLFTREEAAPLHVQVAATAVSSQRIFDWIDEELGRN
jgi:pimeloyl-ACP methyl ester carboxylesterase